MKKTTSNRPNTQMHRAPEKKSVKSTVKPSNVKPSKATPAEKAKLKQEVRNLVRTKRK